MTKVNPVKALTSGQFTTADIGKTVYISNSVAATQEWRIADVNYDSTTGTVDLFPKYILTNTGIGFGAGNYYKGSSLRTWLNGELYGGFVEEIKNAMKVQSIESGTDILNDKVKCPSLMELGLHFHINSSSKDKYGQIYPLFGTEQLSRNVLAVYKTIDDAPVIFWSRTYYYGGSCQTYGVYNGVITDNSYANKQRYIVACIRI